MNCSLWCSFHSTSGEFGSPSYWTIQLGDLFQEFAVSLIDAESEWSTLPSKKVETLFRDGIHPNEVGNQALANLLFQQVSGIYYKQ